MSSSVNFKLIVRLVLRKSSLVQRAESLQYRALESFNLITSSNLNCSDSSHIIGICLMLLYDQGYLFPDFWLIRLSSYIRYSNYVVLRPRNTGRNLVCPMQPFFTHSSHPSVAQLRSLRIFHLLLFLYLKSFWLLIPWSEVLPLQL